MIPLKLVGHFYIDGYGVVSTYQDGDGVRYSTAAQELIQPGPVGLNQVSIVFDGYGVASHKILVEGIRPVYSIESRKK